MLRSIAPLKNNIWIIRYLAKLKNHLKKYADFVESHPLIRLLDSISKLGIVFAAIFWILEIDDRKEERENLRKQRIYRAWEIITFTELMPSSHARKSALEDLVKSKQKLDGIDLRIANLDDANLAGASFSRSVLNNISFIDANLQNVNFDYCFLDEVDFSNSNLKDASFKGAVIKNSSFTSVKTINSLNFSKAILLNNTGLKVKSKLVDSVTLKKIKSIWEKPSDYLDDEELRNIIIEIDSILEFN
ncbi:hypothetical protein D1013_08910 [Euzebyella marina]|uniref:Pentapeptide repeat-containing protein n=1 Tax=Euzebyella marina TaxID=1761453 RepID=A0A3G2L5K7_9FLAO|nr:pentapeptide repeat-containing protein [Euzebyella marina]AYN67471.1 hypothetical protein D1013_08910 [Euzebyella marina]